MIWLCALAWADPTLLTSWDLESDDGGFLSYGDTAQWEWGVVSHGPGGGVDGSHAWSTRLLGSYLNDSTDYLEIPLPDLSTATRPMLRFESWFDIDSGDSAWIEINDGTAWTRLSPVYGYPSPEGFVGLSEGWHTVVVELGGLHASRLRLVFASDVSGGASGWTIDSVALWDGDVSPPKIISVESPEDTQDLVNGYWIRAQVADETALQSVAADLSIGGQSSRWPMTLVDGMWEVQIPPQAPNTTIAGTILASDGWSEVQSVPFSFRVYLPAPQNLRGPEGRVVGTQAQLSWEAPDSLTPPSLYRIWHEQSLILETTDTFGVVPLTGSQDSFYVTAVFPSGEGDPSPTLLIDAIILRLEQLSPSSGWPGEQLQVVLGGDYLLMVQDQVHLDLEDISIGEITVLDVDHAMLHLSIPTDAPAGPRALGFSLPTETLVLSDAFTVLDGQDRPRLSSLSKTQLRQGDRAALQIGFVGTFSAVPTVSMGEGVVIESVIVGQSLLTLSVVVDPDAPLGTRSVWADDGVRRYEGVELEIKDRVDPLARNCATAPAGPWAILLSMGLVAGLRRRS